MNKKGFTLIELLAVIVILAIIALIATPMVLNTIEDARKGAAVSSAYAYISAVETKIATNMIHDTDYDFAEDTTFAVSVKGDTPNATGTSLSVEDGVVKGATLVFGNYTVTYDGKTATIAE